MDRSNDIQNAILTLNPDPRGQWLDNGGTGTRKTVMNKFDYIFH